MSSPEPRNPFYLLLLVTSLLFVLTALAYGVVPVLEQQAAGAGRPPPASPFRDALRENGWKWLLYEVAAMFILGFLSMGLDRIRSLRKESSAWQSPPSGQVHVSSRQPNGATHALD